MAIKEILKEDMLEQVTGGGYCYYKVKNNDTLECISNHLGIPQSTLKSLNGIKNEFLIYPGQSIKYPC